MKFVVAIFVYNFHFLAPIGMPNWVMVCDSAAIRTLESSTNPTTVDSMARGAP
jgi:hypothetical protein